MEPANGYKLLLLVSLLLHGGVAVDELLPPSGLVTFSAVPLNPRSIRVHWTTIENDNGPITGYRVVTTPQTTQGEEIVYEATILGAEVNNHTFTGLSPYEYDQSQDGVGYETTVRSMNANGLGPVSGSVETIIPPCHSLCNFKFYMGSPGCDRCVCNPAYTGEQCDEPTFYPVNVQANEVLVDGSYVLQISWDPPPIENLDGRLIGGYGVRLLRGAEVIGTGSTDDNVTSVNLTISSLERSTNYTIIVETRSDIGDTAQSPPVLTTTLPNPPGTVTDFSAIVTSSTSIQLSWKPPSMTNGPTTGYRIMYTDGEEVLDIYLIETSAVIEGLASNTTYQMRVSAENAGGFGAAVTITITTSADPPCPTLSDPLNGTVTLTGNTTDDAATYSCNDGYSLVGGSSRVCQANGTWSGNEPMCQLCPMDHYVSATDLTCLPCPDNSGSLEGTVNITGCVCFRGYTGNNGGPCNPCPMGTFKPLVGDVPCINCATLLTTSGTGAVECDACRHSSGDPLAGQECYAFDTTIQFSSNTVTDTRIRLFWTPTSTVSSKSGDEVGMVVAYRIWCSATGGSIPDHLLSIDIPPTVSTILFDGLQPLVEYTFNITIIARISNVEEAGPPGPPLMITTLPSPNQSDVSSSIPTSTPSLLPSATVQSIEQPNATPTPTTAAVLLAAPETLTTVALSGTEVTVTWSGVDGASGYEILVTSTHGSDTITVIGGLVLTKAIVNLIPYTNYTITVAGVPEEGNTGTPSEPVYVTTNEELPSPPTNVHVFEEDGSLINVTWSPPEFPNGVITGYKVKITLESGAIMTYTVDPQLSVILPKPSGAYSVSIIAINGIGTSEAEEATIVEQPTVETGATTSSSTDLSTAIVASIVVGGLLFILMLSCLCCVISCFLYYKRKKMGEASFARENSYIYAQGEPDISGLVPLGHPEDQLTAKRWMRMNVNYSSASALLPPMSVNMVETNIDAVDGMYAEVNEMQRMRDGEPGERPPSYLEVVRDAQPCDYCNEELYLSMEKFYFVDVDKTNSLAPYELDDSRLEILEDEPLGEGEFGRVVKGVAKGVVPGQPKSAVAIKMLKEGASDSARKDFLGEAHMLAQFQHQNVMTLLGVVTNKKPSLVITHFMPNGSLKTFLKGQKKKLSKVSLESPRNFRVPDQLEIAEQIASGMEYLASKFFIHRDLAARNVLVGEKNHVKISDFGLSRALARDDTYYYLRESKKLPVKWMALESLEYRKFSTYSDIWSFGVVVWEIFSYGAGPYKGIAPTEVINHLRAGNRLECPEECPQEVYDLMKLCWEEKKEQRPTFSQVKMRLKAIGIASRRKESKNETETSKDNAEDEIYINDDMGP